MMQFFPSSLKTTIPKHNKKGKKSSFLNIETKLNLLLPLETISIPVCHVLWEQFCCYCMSTKTERKRLQLFKEIT